MTFGRAFLIKDVESAREYLDHRESSLGGYATLELDFFPLHGPQEATRVLAYVALPCNPLFLGPAPLETIAAQIAHSEGHSGHNVEYLAKLAAFMKLHVPQQVHYDEHLFALETLVHKYVKSHKPDLLTHFHSALTDVPVFEKEGLHSPKPSHELQEATTGETFLISMRLSNGQSKDLGDERVFANHLSNTVGESSSSPSPLISQSFDPFTTLGPDSFSAQVFSSS